MFCLNGRFVRKINDCCFVKLLRFIVVCYVVRELEFFFIFIFADREVLF